MFLVGEALIGKGPEVAHIDLIIGEKEGPVGTAFASGLTQLSAGHTPLLGVIRPNLPPKPSTLIVPKVTVKNMDQAAQIFGPAQTAVAKAVADSVAEGVIPRDRAEELLVIVSVYIDPKATDYDAIYRYNYGATKLAVQRAMAGFPDVDKVLYEKERSTHPIMGFRVTRLWDPPYLQVAFDLVDVAEVRRVLSALPDSDHILIEVGTPLVKMLGMNVVKEIRAIRPGAFIILDLKTLDTGNLEVRLAADSTADAVVISGLAPKKTIELSINEARKTGIYSIIDMLNVDDPLAVLKGLDVKPDVVELHRAIDMEKSAHAWQNIPDIKALAEEGRRLLVAVAGGIRTDTQGAALAAGADILVVGRAITRSRDIRDMAEQFLTGLKQTEIDQYRIMTDF
ncbi:MAG: bifunctional 5,6,7,8-tetrahydromethanopterin hydro-lyase/3-hexulose-6-phosphate synthase [Methanothrix soehngenii]|uniref:bifunctional 5,6,7,8-tetrahydromethanopterin hydro-lyase/3-hexulose-6-phosphate synthase n=1 Tax=Methanothrix soehngenii TaxID=2223 RepID=UPI0023F2EC0D|nr:bifunctional 5,6,7,8-tetrahydromethanopterin hydro-lyase/3-hexulose-6-phosphate synthase [Methanothrix soehngenii]MDD3974091.1 bifunctional 5,6,7,8-tetrahydromethanopterin hydro-lyase/3-hexulose-6-phosphate synthase [Methanothrix soehngenii]MDD5256522.1 bifunctional 5,6,7,8-tetrahydromethanopterin hydro-lyase/3-hexulose-6-phosphate synthase [Methanothrix soehngenii]MDD5735994.1 bifunctional 5,6,7,8-tetrahydromethanopterin hydro-lyase/3-hexulose-6-phosphate synthase [Methanothrix soehngenii]